MRAWENESFSDWQLRRPKFCRADNRGMGAVMSCMGLPAARHPAQERGQSRDRLGFAGALLAISRPRHFRKYANKFATPSESGAERLPDDAGAIVSQGPTALSASRDVDESQSIQIAARGPPVSCYVIEQAWHVSK